MKNFSKLIIALVTATLAGCNDADIPSTSDNTDQLQAVHIASRLADGSFKENEQIGMYMVNYKDNVPGELQKSGNYVDNVSYTFAGNQWKTSQTVYWKDNKTMADFYAYCPYTKIENARKIPFSISTDQENEANYRASDFLWTKTVAQKPSDGQILLALDHLMSKVLVKVKAGDGFTEKELVEADLSLNLTNVCVRGEIDLKDGSVVPLDSRSSVLPYQLKDLTYQALLIPQQIQDQKLISLQVGTDTFYLTKSLDLQSGKQYTLTVTVSKNLCEVDITVGDWEIVDGDFGGTATK